MLKIVRIKQNYQMDTTDDIVQKHMASVKGMGILENEIDIDVNDLKEISTELGMTDQEWEGVMNLANEKMVLAKSHFDLKSYRECILATEEAQLLNPFVRGARGQKAKAFLLLAINENDDSYLAKAETQAKITLEKESNDKNALEVISTLSSKSRLVRDKEVTKSNKNLALIIGICVIIATVLGAFLYLSGNGDISQQREQLEVVEKQLESAFDKQIALLPKVQALLTDSKEDQMAKSALKEIKSKLENSDLDLKQKFELQAELSDKLSEIVYKKSTNDDSSLLEDIRVLLEGAENRINTERKNYNTAVSEYNELNPDKIEKL